MISRIIKKLSFLIVLVLLAIPAVFPVYAVDHAFDNGNYLVFRGDKRIEIFSLETLDVVSSMHFNDLFPVLLGSELAFEYDLRSGVLNDLGQVFITDRGSKYLLGIDLTTESPIFDYGNMVGDPDVKQIPKAGIDLTDSGSIALPYNMIGQVGYQIFSSDNGMPSSVDFYRLASSYGTSNVRNFGDGFYYLFGRLSTTTKIMRVDSSSHILDRILSFAGGIYRGATITPEGYLAFLDSSNILRIFDYSQVAGSELIFSGALASPHDNNTEAVYFYGDSYDSGFYYYGYNRIYNYSIVGGSLSLNWQSDSFGTTNWGELFDPDVDPDYLYAINYLANGISKLYRFSKIDGTIDGTFSYTTYEGVDPSDSGFYYPARIGEIIPEDKAITAVLTPPDDSTIYNEDIITLTWENLEREISGFELKISQVDDSSKNFYTHVWANFAYNQWVGNEDCWANATEPYTGYSYFGECKIKLSDLSPVIGWVEGSEFGLDYDVKVSAFYLDPAYSDIIMIDNWVWHVIGEEWSAGEWESSTLFPEYDFDSFLDYYAEFGDYPAPSPMIASIGDMFSGTLGQVAGMILAFQNRFNRADAVSIGRSATAGISVIRGYVDSFGIFFGGFPVGMFIMAWLGVNAGVVLWRLIKWIISLIPSIG